MGREAQVDARMLNEILRRQRQTTLGEIRGRANHGGADVRSDAHGDHVLGHLLTPAHPGVETLRRDVGQPIIDGESTVMSG